MSQNKNFTVDDLSKYVGENLSGLDDERAVALDALLVLRKAKNNTLVREYNRLLNVLGPNHPRSARLLNKIDVNRSLMNDLAAEAVRARTELPDPNPNGWILSGFVRDKELRGVSKLSVALYTLNGNEAKDLGRATTNEDGYFRLDADGGLISKYPLLQARAVDGASTIGSDEKPLQPKIGGVDYRELIIK
ncbi:MAG TPA: hypothetical protein VJ842_14015 [Pyrinomonadaceae bacterium]|nr:hypothetical protein [Pyrinomonadaceae bacterium]